MPKKAEQQPDPIEADVLPAGSELAVVESARPRRPWWPFAALAVVLLALTGTVVTTAGASPLRPDAKGAFLEATPRLEGLEEIVAPVPTVTPDPKSFAQKIEIILPPPPPPPVARGGGRGGGGGSGGGGGGSLNRADAGAFCNNINAQREANGLAALSSCYATSSRQAHADAMAASNPPNIWHQGDNIVGVAPSHGALINAFMNSPAHHDQILTSSYTGARVGCAWGQPPGYVPLIYCTADFF